MLQPPGILAPGIASMGHHGKICHDGQLPWHSLVGGRILSRQFHIDTLG
jgi:hypothetical protein